MNQILRGARLPIPSVMSIVAWSTCGSLLSAANEESEHSTTISKNAVAPVRQLVPLMRRVPPVEQESRLSPVLLIRRLPPVEAILTAAHSPRFRRLPPVIRDSSQGQMTPISGFTDRRLR